MASWTSVKPLLSRAMSSETKGRRFDFLEKAFDQPVVEPDIPRVGESSVERTRARRIRRTKRRMGIHPEYCLRYTGPVVVIGFGPMLSVSRQTWAVALAGVNRGGSVGSPRWARIGRDPRPACAGGRWARGRPDTGDGVGAAAG